MWMVKERGCGTRKQKRSTENAGPRQALSHVVLAVGFVAVCVALALQSDIDLALSIALGSAACLTAVGMALRFVSWPIPTSPLLEIAPVVDHRRHSRVGAATCSQRHRQ